MLYKQGGEIEWKNWKYENKTDDRDNIFKSCQAECFLIISAFLFQLHAHWHDTSSAKPKYFYFKFY